MNLKPGGAFEDHWGLLTLQVGKIKFHKCSPEEVRQRAKTISWAGSYYYQKGKIQARLFVHEIDDGEYIGVLYGLKRGFK